MRDAVKSYLTLAAGLTEVTRLRATSAARALVSQGEATAEQVGQLVEDLLSQSRQNREAVSALVTYEVDRALGRLRLASADEVTQLSERVRALEAEVRRLASGSAPAASAPGSKAAGSKAAGGGAQGAKAAGKTAAKKTPGKAATAKKTAARPGAAPGTRSAADAPRGGPSPAEKTASGTGS